MPVQFNIHLFRLALGFYTRLPHRVPDDYTDLPRSAVFLPLIGWLIGTICAVTFYIASALWSQPTAVVLALLAGILTTGALHEDGFADVCDGFGAGINKQRILSIMKDSHIGVYGVVGLIFLLSLKISLLSTLPESTVPFVLFAGHSISRLTPLLLMYHYEYARENSSKAAAAVYRPGNDELAFAALIALLPLALLPPLCLFAAVPLSIATLLLGRYFYQRIGGYTGDCLGASQQLTETLFYLTVNALWTSI